MNYSSNLLPSISYNLPQVYSTPFRNKIKIFRYLCFHSSLVNEPHKMVLLHSEQQPVWIMDCRYTELVPEMSVFHVLQPHLKQSILHPFSADTFARDQLPPQEKCNFPCFLSYRKVGCGEDKSIGSGQHETLHLSSYTLSVYLWGNQHQLQHFYTHSSTTEPQVIIAKHFPARSNRP